MGQLVYILGRSGTGKSYSLRNFPPEDVAVINVQGKMLPFKGAAHFEQTATDSSSDILKALEIYAHDYKSIVVDDYQYVMSNEFMRRSAEKGYDKFTEIARHAWDIANKVRELPDDVIVYIMCHIDRDDDGNEKIKTIGKLLDEKICLEGLSTIVLKTNVSDGQYTFLTQNNGKDTVKSPFGMFPTYAIDNDLWYVDLKIRNYYEIGEFADDGIIEELDQAAAKEEITKEAASGRRRRTQKAEIQVTTDKQGLGNADGQGTVSEPEQSTGSDHARRRRRTSESEAIINEAEEKMKDTGTGTIVGATLEELKEESKEPETKVRRRKERHGKAEEEKSEEAPAEEKKEAAETEGKRRRRRRTSGDDFMTFTDDDGTEVPF